MPFPLIAMGIFAGISAIAGIIRSSQTGKTVDVEEKTYDDDDSK